MKAISVSQLNNYIKQVFEAEEMLHNIEVVGEIDGINSRGNAIYFSLKDKEAVISCSSFHPQKFKDIKNGERVSVRGTVSYWNKAGKISFVVHSCEAFGLGALFQKFEELKKRLEAEGLFGVKKALPAEVRRIGVVTSKSGAVLHDIIKVAHRRNPNVDIVLYNVAVQGDGADRQVCEGIEYFAGGSVDIGTGEVNFVDVIIVARGGGSKEDLAVFNSECVARAVFASSVPVVSAVGHETDWTLIDMVADLRAATPSMAAELVVREVTTQREAVMSAYRHLRTTLKSKIERLFGRITSAWAVMKSSVTYKMSEREARVQALSGVISANNPLAVLRRGYAKVYKADKQVVGVEDAEVGDKLDIKLYNGEIGAEVIWTKKLPKLKS
jgi:exodeoxyribonuclease VII large subunit